MKIWSDKKYLRHLNDVRPILMPFWGTNKKDEPHKDRFDDWINRGQLVFQMTSMDNADVVIYPQDPTIDPKGFLEFQKITQNKRMLVFFNSDSEKDISMRKNSILFRTSKKKSYQLPNEFGLPGWSEDWGKLPFITDHIPTISFCGQDFKPEIRLKALNILEKSSLKTNFIRKQKFWGGWIETGKNPEFGRKLRAEYISNLQTSEYCFCARGGGNFSYRLYETMMSGRIPILVNTECILPYDFIINWANIFPIVNEKHINEMPDIILDFHKKINHKEKQNEIRNLWEQYISLFGFFSNIYKHWSEKELC